tara:strand:- start:35884 stop:36702 length:819 start_codon:yes stop_codon:yes gene_type:complete
MKKITLKITLVLLTVFTFQVKAQVIHTEVVDGTVYNLRNVETNQYLRVAGNDERGADTPGSDAEILSMVDYDGTDANLNWKFVATEFGGNPVWNIEAQARGIIRFVGGGGGYRVISTAFSGPRPDSDKVQLATYDAEAGGFRIANPAGSRFMHISTVDGEEKLLNVGADEVEGKKDIWVLEVSEIVLSTETFSVDAFSISNPINNQLTIKGATSDVSKVSLYSVLGSKVISKSINNNIGDINLNVSDLSNGLYILEMTGVNGQRFTKKIVKQ